jgi:hypothetical protein
MAMARLPHEGVRIDLGVCGQIVIARHQYYERLLRDGHEAQVRELRLDAK